MTDPVATLPSAVPDVPSGDEIADGIIVAGKEILAFFLRAVDSIVPAATNALPAPPANTPAAQALASSPATPVTVTPDSNKATTPVPTDDEAEALQGFAQGYRDNTYDQPYAYQQADVSLKAQGYAYGWQQAYDDFVETKSLGSASSDGGAYGGNAVNATSVSGIGCLPQNTVVAGGSLEKNVVKRS